MATAVKLGQPIARKPAAVALAVACVLAVAIGRVSPLIVMPVAVVVSVVFSWRRML
jgi:CHASE2 domain-containing sensor protein